MNLLEIQFSLRGRTLPSDHGFALYSAIKNIVQSSETELQLADNILLCSISGINDRDGLIYLNKYSRFRIRCPANDAQAWYGLLQNQVLDIRGHLIRLIQPRLTLIQSSETLKARLVTFKFNIDRWHHQEMPVYFLESCQKALANLDINGQVFIDSNTEGNLAQRAIKIHHKNCLGYGVVVEGLNEEDSIKLQCIGLGGRKHFGCGWFYPIEEVNNVA
jgi:CRISPR-associated protein Cas6